MKKTLLTLLFGAGLFFGAGEQEAKAQDENNTYFNEEYKSYFEVVEPDGRTWTLSSVPLKYSSYINSWLCTCPKEEEKGFLWINFYDFEGDKFYDYVTIRNYLHKIRTFEKFRFYPSEKKEIDYTLQFYKKCDGVLTDCEEILKKEYSKITGEEAFSIGENFVKRINSLVTSQKDFNRFNTGLIDNLLRKEANQWDYKYIDGKYKFTKIGFPIYRYLSEEEINKIESVLQE